MRREFARLFFRVPQNGPIFIKDGLADILINRLKGREVAIEGILISFIKRNQMRFGFLKQTVPRKVNPERASENKGESKDERIPENELLFHLRMYPKPRTVSIFALEEAIFFLIRETNISRVLVSISASIPHISFNN